MNKINKHIEIARSTGNGLSSMSKASCNAIFAVLTKHYTTVSVRVVNNLSDIDAMIASRPDLVFLGMKFVPINHTLGLKDPARVWISDYLDKYNIAYTGSNQRAHAFGTSKPLAKQRAIDVGLNTSKFYVAKQERSLPKKNTSLAYPLFVKPTSRGGGLGIDSDSLVNNLIQLQSKVLSIASELQSDALVEEYLPGREFSVAIIKEQYPEEYLVMPLELIAPENEHGIRLLSEQVKSSNTERTLEVTDEVIKTKISTLALNMFYALGARDYGRIDIRLNKAGVPQFLEANLMPNLENGYGSFPKACMLNIGLEYEAMILRIVELGLARAQDIIEDSLGLDVANIPLEAVLEPV